MDRRPFGDRDGDGYVEYQRATDRGLVEPGLEGLVGRRPASPTAARPEPPIALCEVQGYVYAAFVARSHFADEHGDHELAEQLRDAGRDLKEAFNRDFWLEEQRLASPWASTRQARRSTR